jgi:hypothetical protein
MKQGTSLVLAALVVLALSMLILNRARAHDTGEHAAESTPAADSTPVANQDSLYAVINASYQSVRPILEKGCFDCHSSYTKYPWYHKLPIIGGMMDDHIKEGREHLDLSNDFPFGRYRSQVNALKDIKDEVEEGDMPLWSYRLAHWSAAPDDTEKDSLFAWIDSSLVLLGDTTGTAAGEEDDD